MRQYTHLFGTLTITCQNTRYEVTIVPKEHSILFPVTPLMTESEIKTVLANHLVFNDKNNRDRLAELGHTLHTMRNTIFNSLKHDSVVIDKDFFDLSKTEFEISSIGSEDSVEEGAVLLPRNSTVKIVSQVFPLQYNDLPHEEHIISDYLSEVYEDE